MNKKGFTLIEIMIVVAIIALLIAIVITNLSAKRTVNTVAAKANILALSKAAEGYAVSHNGVYPANAAAIAPYIAQATVLCASSAASPVQGYVYNCTGLSAAGYTLTATPAGVAAGETTFSVTNGRVITETPYVAPTT